MNTGLTGVNIFVRPEEQACFDGLKAQLESSLQPATAHERYLFDLALSAAWNLRRCIAVEAEIQNEAHALGLPDAFFDERLAKQLERVNRYKRQHETSYRRAMADLKKLAAARQPDPPPQPKTRKPKPAFPQTAEAVLAPQPPAMEPSATLRL